MAEPAPKAAKQAAEPTKSIVTSNDEVQVPVRAAVEKVVHETNGMTVHTYVGVTGPTA